MRRHASARSLSAHACSLSTRCQSEPCFVFISLCTSMPYSSTAGLHNDCPEQLHASSAEVSVQHGDALTGVTVYDTQPLHFH